MTRGAATEIAEGAQDPISNSDGLSSKPPYAHSAEAAADLLSLPYETFLGLLRTGAVKGKRVGKRWVVPDWALHEFLKPIPDQGK